MRWIPIVFVITMLTLSACNGQEKTQVKEIYRNLTAFHGTITEVFHRRDGYYWVIIETGRPHRTITAINVNDLQYPESFMIFKKGDEAVVYGVHTGRDSMKVVKFTIVQPEKLFKETIAAPLSKDSVKIENIVEFYTYEDDHTSPTPSVRFTLRVTNLSDRLIPALTPSNNSIYFNKKESITEFYMNDGLGGLSIYNGMGFERELINKGNVTETAEGSTLTKDSGILMKGDTITVQWKYMGILSEKVTVDLKNKRILP